MHITDTSQHTSFLIAALLAGRLYRVLSIAKIMSISSSNAKGISIRGGTLTAGFKPITDFINDMATDTISISARINATSLNFSIKSVNELRAQSVLHDFQKVIDRLDDHTHQDRLLDLIASIQEDIDKLRT